MTGSGQRDARKCRSCADGERLRVAGVSAMALEMTGGDGRGPNAYALGFSASLWASDVRCSIGTYGAGYAGPV